MCKISFNTHSIHVILEFDDKLWLLCQMIHQGLFSNLDETLMYLLQVVFLFVSFVSFFANSDESSKNGQFSSPPCSPLFILTPFKALSYAIHFLGFLWF